MMMIGIIQILVILIGHVIKRKSYLKYLFSKLLK
jgi:hypothetical protein